MNMTGPPWIKLNMLKKNKLDSSKATPSKLPWFHLSITSFYAKKLHWFSDSISILSFFMDLEPDSLKAFTSLPYQIFLGHD